MSAISPAATGASRVPRVPSGAPATSPPELGSVVTVSSGSVLSGSVLSGSVMSGAVVSSGAAVSCGCVLTTTVVWLPGVVPLSSSSPLVTMTAPMPTTATSPMPSQPHSGNPSTFGLPGAGCGDSGSGEEGGGPPMGGGGGGKLLMPRE